MKFLKTEEHARLTSAAQNYQAIVAAAKEADPTLADNAGAEELLAAITAGGEDPSQISALQNEVAMLKNEVATLQSSIASKDDIIKALKQAPAAPAANLDAKTEPVATEHDPIEAIGKKHVGDPVGMLNAMKQEGLI